VYKTGNDVKTHYKMKNLKYKYFLLLKQKRGEQLLGPLPQFVDTNIGGTPPPNSDIFNYLHQNCH
jgi:hypothetical protein